MSGSFHPSFSEWTFKLIHKHARYLLEHLSYYQNVVCCSDVMTLKCYNEIWMVVKTITCSIQNADNYCRGACHKHVRLLLNKTSFHRKYVPHSWIIHIKIIILGAKLCASYTSYSIWPTAKVAYFMESKCMFDIVKVYWLP